MNQRNIIAIALGVLILILPVLSINLFGPYHGGIVFQISRILNKALTTNNPVMLGFLAEGIYIFVAGATISFISLPRHYKVFLVAAVLSMLLYSLINIFTNPFFTTVSDVVLPASGVLLSYLIFGSMGFWGIKLFKKES